MATPLSIRFEDGLLARLRRRAGVTASSTSSLAQRLIDEGLRMADHPGVIFKDGPTGRRAALASGPDVWEVIKFLREIDERGPARSSRDARRRRSMRRSRRLTRRRSELSGPGSCSAA